MDEKEDKTMAFLGSFKKSAMELKDVRAITVTALFIALDLAIKSLTVTIMPDLKVSFAFVAKACIGMLYGPTVGFISGTVSDIISFLIKPTGTFSPLFTLVEATGAMLYGLFLYNIRLTKIEFGKKSDFGKSVKQNGKQIIRIMLAKLSVVVACNLIMTPLALVITQSMEAGTLVYGSVLMKYPARLLKNAIQYPVDCFMLIILLPIVAVAYNLVFRSHKKNIVEIQK